MVVREESSIIVPLVRRQMGAFRISNMGFLIFSIRDTFEVKCFGGKWDILFERTHDG